MYEADTGQLINYQKYEIFFNSNTPRHVKTQISSLLGVSEIIGRGKYWGLPSISIRRKRKVVFNFLKDKIWSRLNHWLTKNLSKVGKETLIMSPTQSIPTYCMRVFLLPSTLEEELQRMMNLFWWGLSIQQSKVINWLKWEKHTMKKEHGSMGFRHLHAFNLAMLEKQG